MDDYTRKVVEVLLEHDRQYLSELIGARVPEGATVDTVCAMIIADQDQAKQKEHISSIYRCNRCSSKTVVVRDVQLRSADEGSTAVYLCRKCGHTW
jgi:DNA-directed RNA polymerase subunit M/transcription elongation factor TFIIS